MPSTTVGAGGVHVAGLAEEVTDPAEIARLRLLPLRQWGREEAERFVKISVHLLSGRRVFPVAA